jgi:hypothetical protein
MTEQQDSAHREDPEQDVGDSSSHEDRQRQGAADDMDMYATTVSENDTTWFCIKDRDSGAWIRSTFSKNLRKFR